MRIELASVVWTDPGKIECFLPGAGMRGFAILSRLKTAEIFEPFVSIV